MTRDIRTSKKIKNKKFKMLRIDTLHVQRQH